MRVRLVLAAILLLCPWLVGPGLALSRAWAAEADQSAVIPVTISQAEARDVPVWLSGLGAVSPLNRVAVKPRVDGQLDSVAFTEGQEVRRGDIIAQIDPRLFQAALDQAVAKQAQDAASLANAQADLARYQRLAASAFASVQQADTQKTAVAQLDAQMRQDQASIAMARLQLGFTTIRAPLDGRIGLRQVDPGSIVHAGDADGLVTITQMAPIGALFTLPQDNLPDIRSAMAAGPVIADAYSRDDTRQLARGHLVFVDSAVDPASGQVKLKAEFENSGRELWPGQFVTVRVLVRTIHQAIVVPSKAVERNDDGPYVFRLQPDDTVAVQPVSVAMTTGSLAIVDQGITPGERIVSAGQYRLRSGSRVTTHAAP